MANRRNVWGILIVLVAALVAFGVFRHRRSTGGPFATAAGGDEGKSFDPPNLLPDEPSSDATLARGNIAGRVTNPTGRPIAGAAVCAFASSGRLVSAETRAPRCATADTDGRYRIDDLLVATYEVSASAPHHQPARWRSPDKEKTSLELKAGATRSEIDLILTPGGVEVRGRVSDIGGGPVAGALVTIASSEGFAADGNGSVASSNAQGEWQAWTAEGSIHARAVAEGYAEGSTDGVAPGQFIEIALTPESVLQGRVVEAGTDTPVVGARVSAQPQGDGADDSTALSDAEGRFRISRLPPGRYKPEAKSAHRRGIARESVLLGVGETSGEVRIEVHPAVTVSGRIELADAPHTRGVCTNGAVVLVEKAGTERAWSKADEHGRVQIEGVLPGRYDVEIECEGAVLADQYEPISAADKDISGLIWNVKKGFTLRGKVVDSTGQPVGSAQLRAWMLLRGSDPRARTGTSEARSEKDGSFRLRGLSAATYQISVQHGEISALKDPIEVKVTRDVDGLRIVLPAGGSIEGTIVDGTGVPVPGLDVHALGDQYAFGEGSSMSRDNGTFVLKGLNPGEYRVWAGKWWRRARSPGTKDDDVQGVSATVRAGAVARVKLVVEGERGEIRGRVVEDGNQPVTDAFIDVERESDSTASASGDAERTIRWEWGRRKPVLANLDGQFSVTKLSPGAYTVRAFRKGGGEAVAEHVQVGSQITLTIRVPGRISGTVVGSKGRAPERFTVAVVDEKKGFQRQETFFRTGGTFTLRDLPAGDFDVSAEASEGRALAHIGLAEGEKHDGLRLELEENASVRGRVVALDTGQPVAGLGVYVAAAKGVSSLAGSDEGARKNVTDSDGRFEIARCPTGRVIVEAFPRDYLGSEYAFAYVPATLEAGRSHEVPELRIPRRRTKGTEVPGDLGFTAQETSPGVDLEQTRNMVSVVRPNGPAAAAELLVGDEIVSVDGQDVVGANSYLFHALTQIPAGSRITLGLRRDAAVVIQATKPL